jgi:hypothetical protein
VHGVVDERHAVQHAVHLIEHRGLDTGRALALGGVALPRLEPGARVRPKAPAVDLDQTRRDRGGVAALDARLSDRYRGRGREQYGDQAVMEKSFQMPSERRRNASGLRSR